MKIVLVLATGFTLLSGQALIDRGELECEEAVKHLVDCCGSDDVAVHTVTCYAERGCGSSRPDLEERLAVCLRDASCHDVIASGACLDPRNATCGR